MNGPSAAAAGLGAFALAGVLFFLAQRLRALGLVRRVAGKLGPRLDPRALAAVAALRDVEDALVAFYRHHRVRFVLSLAASLCEWTTGTVAAWIAVNALGHPLGWDGAMAIEAFVVLVRSSLFFVPADVGTQEGALALVCGAVTGSPAASSPGARATSWPASGTARSASCSRPPSSSPASRSPRMPSSPRSTRAKSTPKSVDPTRAGASSRWASGTASITARRSSRSDSARGRQSRGPW